MEAIASPCSLGAGKGFLSLELDIDGLGSRTFLSGPLYPLPSFHGRENPNPF